MKKFTLSTLGTLNKRKEDNLYISLKEWFIKILPIYTFDKYKSIIINNKKYFSEIISSLIIYSLFLIFLYYILYTFINIKNIKYEIVFEYTKKQHLTINEIRKYSPSIIQYKNKIYILDGKGNIINTFEKVDNDFFKKIKFFDYYIAFYNYDFIIGFKIKDYYIYIDFFTEFYQFLKVFSIMIWLLMLGTIIILFEILKNENKKTLLKLANTESMATNNSMIILTENIHHELNTPFAIIENKHNKMKKNILRFVKFQCSFLGVNIKNIKDVLKCEKCNQRPEIIEVVKNILDDDEYIQIALKQMNGILENMRDFKKLRNSNGNKTIYDIIEGSIKILKATQNSDFNYEIDEEFKNYKLNHSSKMKNSDLISVLLNHFKNSLEANAITIKIYIDKRKINSYGFDGKYLYFIIEDDGNGIDKKSQNKIFDMDYSSKDENSTIGLRGNGMYLNKNLLNVFGGDSILLWSEKNVGTKFLIKVPAVEAKKKLKKIDKG